MKYSLKRLFKKGSQLGVVVQSFKASIQIKSVDRASFKFSVRDSFRYELRLGLELGLCFEFVLSLRLVLE